MNSITPFLDCREDIRLTENRLEHWQQANRFQFVTWNLRDAVPGKALKRIKRLEARWRESHPKPWSVATCEEHERRFRRKVERWMDLGRGNCCLQRPPAADALENVLWFREEVDYRLDAYVIMPNHVHILFQMSGDEPLEKILKPWKGVSSRRIHQALGGGGTLWQADYWDRMIRSPAHYRHVRRYIEENPGKGNVPSGHFRLWMREPALWESLKEEGCRVRPAWGPLR